MNGQRINTLASVFLILLIFACFPADAHCASPKVPVCDTPKYSEHSEKVISGENCSALEEFVEEYFKGRIIKEMFKYYNENALHYPGLYSLNFVSIENKAKGFHKNFMLTFEIVTYKGAHNPPFSKDFLMFSVDFNSGNIGDVKLLEYVHTEL